MKYAYSMAACAAMGTLALAHTAFEPTKIEGHFVEQFTSELSESRWSPSRATKDEVAGEVFSYVGKWAIEEPEVFPGLAGDKALVIKSKAAHHAISVPFESSYDPNSKTTVVSYEVKLQKGLECGGAYIKLLEDSAEGIQAEEFSDKTPYSIMFGPDRCGPTSKVHFIVRHKNPVTGEVEEKHLMSPPAPKITKTSALYTLIIHGDDQTYEIKVNNESQKKGSLLEDFSPPFSPPEEIDDATDEKPADWVEQPKIADPDATKPSDWDEEAPATILDLSEERPASWLANEPLTIPDPAAEKPEEWSDEDDGDYLAPEIPNPACAAPGVAGCGPWTPPTIPNPAYKGPWFAPLIDNPEYKGVWKPKKVANPAYFKVDPAALFSPIGGIGIELWSMTEDIAFDNIYVGSSEKDAAAFVEETFVVKKPLEDKAEESAKPVVEEKKEDVVAPELAVHPVGFATYHAQRFFDHAKADPVGALKAKPETAGALAAAFATLFTVLTLLLSLVTPKAKPVVAKKAKAAVEATKAAAVKKTDEATADDVDAKGAVEDISEAPLAEKKAVVEERLTGVKTRAGKTKANAD